MLFCVLFFLETMEGLIEKLKSPVLVSNFQQYFGVKISYDKSNENNLNNTDKYQKRPTYVVENKFWYWLFYFGTLLGDEVFYAIFIPSWFWNVDGAVGRRVILVWAIVMYIGKVN